MLFIFIILIISVLISIILFPGEGRKYSILVLLFSAFLLRLLFIHIDPFIHEWDERFHALVAKNVMDAPLTPMLFKKHIMAYNLEDWGYNHIWVHKQPVFLWQMAASMKIFGVHPWALRLPSALLGVIAVWCIYDLGSRWTKNQHVGFIAALIAAFSNYPLEMTSGRISLDHNDLVFICYMTLAFWAFVRYTTGEIRWKWALLVGVFAGMAILNKWLVGLLVFGGWGLYLLLSIKSISRTRILHFLGGIGTACLIFIPWQVYIRTVFPRESAVAYAYNWKHIVDDLGHPGDWMTHLDFLPTAYSHLLLVFMGVGLVIILVDRNIDKKLTLSILAMIMVVFSFFSLVVATKMPAFVYVVSPLLIIAAAYAIYLMLSLFAAHFSISQKRQEIVFGVVCLFLCWNVLKPAEIVEYRKDSNEFRNKKMNNRAIYEQIPDSIANNYVILNCKPYENIELMFYKNALAYHWYPTAEVLDSLQNQGYKFAAFDYPGDQQSLPEFMRSDSAIIILPQSPK